MDSATAPSRARSTRHASNQSSAAKAVMPVVPLISAKPSLGAKRTVARPAARKASSAGTRRPWSCFAGYSIYFPEIFPTRLRGTGVGFCYNTVRYLAAPFPFLLGWLSTLMPFRTVGVIMSSIYLVGIVALIWAPETKGQPLPED